MSIFGRLLGRRQSRWDAAWRAFPGVVDDAPALWRVDLGAVFSAPVTHLPVRVDIEVPCDHGPDGLPIDMGRLAQIEDAVRACVANLDGVYVGRVATLGICRFTAHLPNEPTSQVQVEGVADARTRTEYDPHWAYVRDSLAPDDRQHRLLEDLAVVESLSEHGDALGTPRAVEHVAFFAEQASAEGAAADLRGDGFAASVERDDEGDFALVAQRADPVAPPRVHELSWAVKETVERYGGIYDGWRCAVAA